MAPDFQPTYMGGCDLCAQRPAGLGVLGLAPGSPPTGVAAMESEMDVCRFDAGQAGVRETAELDGSASSISPGRCSRALRPRSGELLGRTVSWTQAVLPGWQVIGRRERSATAMATTRAEKCRMPRGSTVTCHRVVCPRVAFLSEPQAAMGAWTYADGCKMPLWTDV
jgi:hypothetical protein